MAYLGVVKLGTTLTVYANTHTPATGAAVDADAAPGYRVYEDETAGPLLTGSMALLDDANTTGFYSEALAITTANGFEAGKSYSVRITGVVGGVTGVNVDTFSVSAALLDDGVAVASIAAGAITATAIATGAIDADALAADAGAELADAVWDEATSGHVVAGTTGKALGDAGAAGDPWAAATRTLTSSAAATVAAMIGSALVVTKSVTYGATISGLTIPASWKAIYLTAKASTSLADSASQIQIQESVAGTGDGLLYIHGNTATEAGLVTADASLTVSQAAGTIAIVIDDEATAELVAGTYSYDVKCLLADGTSQQLSGSATFTVQDAVTETV